MITRAVKSMAQEILYSQSVVLPRRVLHSTLQFNGTVTRRVRVSEDEHQMISSGGTQGAQGVAPLTRYEPGGRESFS